MPTRTRSSNTNNKSHSSMDPAPFQPGQRSPTTAARVNQNGQFRITGTSNALSAAAMQSSPSFRVTQNPLMGGQPVHVHGAAFMRGHGPSSSPIGIVRGSSRRLALEAVDDDCDGSSPIGQTPKTPKRASITIVSHRKPMTLSPSGRLVEKRDGSQGESFRNMKSSRFLELSSPEQAAVFEHQVVAHCCSPTRILRREFGRGIYGYFIFLQYLMCVNLACAVIAGVIFGISYTNLLDNHSFSMFFTAMYSRTMWLNWLITTSVIVALPALAGFLYPLIHKHVVAAGTLDAQDVTSSGDDREDIRIRGVTYRERRTRRIISGILFTLLIVGQTAITYAIYLGLSGAQDKSISLVVAFSNNMLNFIQKFLSKRLTFFELHRKVTTHREADTLKLFLLKFVNVIMLYVIKTELVSATDATSNAIEADLISLTCAAGFGNSTQLSNAGGTPLSSSLTCTCPLLSQGWTFFWLLVFDVAFSVIVEPLTGVALQQYRKCIANKQGLSDYDVQLDFDVAEELVSVLYRQFIILLGAPVFPLITLLGFGAYVVEYYMDRIKLVTLCKKTVIREEPIDLRLIVAATAIVSLAAAFSYPQGLLFLGLRYRAQECAFLS